LRLNKESAERLSIDAYSALHEAWDKSKKLEWSDSVKASQLCIELSVKGMLKLFDVEYPPDHDVSEKLAVIAKKIQGIPDYVLEAIARSRIASNVWEPVHSFSVYGAFDVRPSRLFKETDAKAAAECASDAHTCLSWLLHLAGTDQLQPRS
jgi:HEPN domain-containing protein